MIIKNIVHNPDHIPGIYNYCDRWCERCPFTARCLTYRMEEERRREAGKIREKDDSGTTDVWQEVKKTLDETIELLKDLMQERGIDIDKIETDEEYMISEVEIRENSRAHPLTRMSQAYITLTKAWMEGHEQMLEEAGIREETPPAGRDEKTVRLWDAAKIIRWYFFQISVKIQRALQGKQRHEGSPEDAYGSDSDGSAKVALLGIDRSLQAWHTLLELFPAEEETIADIMILLGRLRKKTEEEFPRARSFRRPGFDDPEFRELVKGKD